MILYVIQRRKVSANLVNREQRQGHQGFLKRLMAILEV
jgi:hypothetical protein